MIKRPIFEITKLGSTKNTQNTRLIAASSHAKIEDGKRRTMSMYKIGRKSVKRSRKKLYMYHVNILIILSNDFQAKATLMHINETVAIKHIKR